MEIRPLTPVIGAEAINIDLTKRLSNSEIIEIKQAFTNAGVLIVRNQNLNPEQFIQFARYFGSDESYSGHLSEYLLPDHPEIISLSNIVENGKALGVQDAGQYWHTDRSYVATPGWASVLFSKKIPHDDDGNPLG
ncbi:MAG: TauD/TfdA family dioxygenase, partial [Betaproteobacteria bacterium]